MSDTGGKMCEDCGKREANRVWEGLLVCATCYDSINKTTNFVKFGKYKDVTL